MPTFPLAHQFQLKTLEINQQDDTLVRLRDGSLRSIAEVGCVQKGFADIRAVNWPEVEGEESLSGYLERNSMQGNGIPYKLQEYISDFDNPRNLSAKAALDFLYDKSAEEGDFRILSGYD